MLFIEYSTTSPNTDLFITWCLQTGCFKTVACWGIFRADLFGLTGRCLALGLQPFWGGHLKKSSQNGSKWVAAQWLDNRWTQVVWGAECWLAGLCNLSVRLLHLVAEVWYHSGSQNNALLQTLVLQILLEYSFSSFFPLFCSHEMQSQLNETERPLIDCDQ